MKKDTEKREAVKEVMSPNAGEVYDLTGNFLVSYCSTVYDYMAFEAGAAETVLDISRKIVLETQEETEEQATESSE